MTSANERYAKILGDIEHAATAAGRDPASVLLLAVSKRQPVSAIAGLAALGQRRFGENFVQEASVKIATLADRELEWHFIGRLQSNKTREVAAHFAWMHSIDRLKIAQRLNDQRPTGAPPLNVCVEVNISGEPGKGGIDPDELPEFTGRLRAMPRLMVRGLMALPAPTDDYAAQRRAFRAVADLAATAGGNGLDTLSIGTSGDYQAAIAEGATIVRIGTALFGPRGE